jgi:dolichol-phosphate mannosyltransferase
MPVIYNEGDKFLRQIERMSSRSQLADIVVAARESTDGCTNPEFLKKCGTQSLLETSSPGAASAIRAGFWHALHQGYEGVVLVDGHNKDGIEAIAEFLKKLDEGYDFVQGSRFMKGGEEKNTPLLRKIGIRLLMAPLLFYGCHFWYSDGTNGFRGYSRRCLEQPRVEPFRNCFTHLNLQYYLSYIAPKIGLKVIEIPVKRVYPDDGTVPTKCVGFAKNFEAFWEMVRTVNGLYDIKS